MAQKLDVSFLYMYVCFNKPFLNLNLNLNQYTVTLTVVDCHLCNMAGFAVISGD